MAGKMQFDVIPNNCIFFYMVYLDSFLIDSTTILGFEAELDTSMIGNLLWNL